MLKKIEFLAKKSHVRTFLQEVFEIRILKRHVTLAPNKTVLEIGCGKGTGTRLIKKYFHPDKTYGLDIDPKVIEAAKLKTKDKDIIFTVGDAAKLDFKDKMFDAVFDFGVIYHISNWKDSLREFKRVLKPGGLLILEELSIDTFEHSLGRLIRKFFDRPYKTMYRRDEFLEFLEKEGWRIATKKILHPLSLEYFIVIAKKP
jgi:ubiquinone/menaquinone biosynthesis C-methylase UbiE